MKDFYIFYINYVLNNVYINYMLNNVYRYISYITEKQEDIAKICEAFKVRIIK